MTKIGIYSGAFDPVHNGHVQFALYAHKQCGLDKIMFMTEPEPRRKQGVKALEHRQNMVDIAIAPYKQLSHILLDQTQFSVDKTLPVLQSRFSNSKLYFLLGDDVIDNLIHWPHLHVLVKSCAFIIGVRKKTVKDIDHTMKILEQTIGKEVEHKLIAVNQQTVSSNRVRSLLRQGKKPKSIDSSVRDYIQQNNLYSSRNL